MPVPRVLRTRGLRSAGPFGGRVELQRLGSLPLVTPIHLQRAPPTTLTTGVLRLRGISLRWKGRNTNLGAFLTLAVDPLELSAFPLKFFAVMLP